MFKVLLPGVLVFGLYLNASGGGSVSAFHHDMVKAFHRQMVALVD